MKVSDHRTGWFPTLSGVKQEDVLSPTLSAIYINNLVLIEIKQAAFGVELGDFTVDTLLYTDDTVLLAVNVNDLQCLLNIVCCWGSKWRFKIKTDNNRQNSGYAF